MEIIIREDLPILLEKIAPNGLGVEVGSLYGRYAKSILEKWSGTLCLIDPWKEFGDEYDDAGNALQKNHREVYEEVVNNMVGFEDRGIPIRATSKVASKLFADESLDFVYIDANHAYDFVVENIALWFPKLKKGGLFAGHDYLKMDWYTDPLFAPNKKDKFIWSSTVYLGLFGVNPAVDEFCKEHKYEPKFTTEWFSTWYFIK